MKLLKCKLCRGEMDIVGNEHSFNKKVKCSNPKCGFSNCENFSQKKEPEVIIRRKYS